MKVIFTIYLSLLFSQQSMAEAVETDVGDSLAEKVKSLSEKIKSHVLMESDNFPETLLKYRKTASSYLGELEVYCRRGHKKTLEQEAKKRIKMSKEERKGCFNKLKLAYADIIQKVYFAQKKNIQKSHEEELEKLGNLRKQSLIDLEKAYKRYLK